MGKGEKIKQVWKNKEIKSMNDIFEKEDKNEYFTQEELEFVKDIDLFDRYSIEIAKMIWKAKDNSKLLKVFLSILENEGMKKETMLINNL